MTLGERVKYFAEMFAALECTPSRLAKQAIVDKLPPELKSDFEFCLSVLDGRKKIGYTVFEVPYISSLATPAGYTHLTIEQYLAPLWQPLAVGDLSRANIVVAIGSCPFYQPFYMPLVNRWYRLGIGRSILPPNGMAPMLAKKYEGQSTHFSEAAITEKLDGNRCIAWYDGSQWQYQSRNGRPMKVQFDMSQLPTDRVYDGEILSRGQVYRSTVIADAAAGLHASQPSWTVDSSFNRTSGLINRHNAAGKALVYNVFDVLDDDLPYRQRRAFLDELSLEIADAPDVRVLPLLATVDGGFELGEIAGKTLDLVTSLGGEGVMINFTDDHYQHKRTNSLLKYKKVQTMDMRVVDVYPGTGLPGPGRDGAIEVALRTESGDFVSCKVGSGLSKEQCELWSIDPGLIIGKTVEIAYHELSQNKSTDGTGSYSLRFPRLKQIREDKNDVSEH